MDKFTPYSKDPEFYNQYKKGDVIQNSRYDYNFAGNDCGKDKSHAILMIDSRFRRINEEPSAYTVVLPKEYMSVTSIELLTVDLPNSNYILNEFNNCFYFQDSEDMASTSCNKPYHKIILPIGDYTFDSTDPAENTVRSLLEDGLNAVNPTNVYSVSVDKNTSKITIEQTAGSGFFNILFQQPFCNSAEKISYNYDAKILPNSIGCLLGFKTATDKTGDISYTGEYRHTLFPSRYIILRLNDFDKNFNRLDSNNEKASGGFITLGLDTRTNNFNKMDNCDYKYSEDYLIEFNPPLPKLTKFTISITDDLGNPYNFRGLNHFLTFQINSLTRNNKYCSK